MYYGNCLLDLQEKIPGTVHRNTFRDCIICICNRSTSVPGSFKQASELELALRGDLIGRKWGAGERLQIPG